jgi:hypothetical protein
MRRSVLYLDTSVLNFFFEVKDLEKAKSTRKLFIEIREREISKASTPKKNKLLSLIRTYDLPWLEVNEECIGLADNYMQKRIFPAKYRDDGLHIATATVHGIDVVVSWNLKHMVKLRTRREVKAVNIFEGYKEIEICTPMEVIESD